MCCSRRGYYSRRWTSTGLYTRHSSTTSKHSSAPSGTTGRVLGQNVINTMFVISPKPASNVLLNTHYSRVLSNVYKNAINPLKDVMSLVYSNSTGLAVSSVL